MLDTLLVLFLKPSYHYFLDSLRLNSFTNETLIFRACVYLFIRLIIRLSSFPSMTFYWNEVKIQVVAYPAPLLAPLHSLHRDLHVRRHLCPICRTLTSRPSQQVIAHYRALWVVYL